MTLVLYRDAVDFLSWQVDDLPTGATMEAHLAGAWHTLERRGDRWGLMVAGPDVTAVPEGAVVLPASQGVRLRRIGGDSGSNVIVTGGWIDLDELPTYGPQYATFRQVARAYEEDDLTDDVRPSVEYAIDARSRRLDAIRAGALAVLAATGNPKLRGVIRDAVIESVLRRVRNPENASLAVEGNTTAQLRAETEAGSWFTAEELRAIDAAATVAQNALTTEPVVTGRPFSSAIPEHRWANA